MCYHDTFRDGKGVNIKARQEESAWPFPDFPDLFGENFMQCY